MPILKVPQLLIQFGVLGRSENHSDSETRRTEDLREV
jgi:hypothetical protein